MIRKKTVSKEGMRLKMADLCSRSEQCEGEIREKLWKSGLSSGDIDDIVDFLISEKFIDNSRYAKAFARDKVKFSGWGRNKIRMMLAMKKRIDSAIISEALQCIDSRDYEEALHKAASAKARSLNLNDFNDRKKLAAHLIGKGFEPELAFEAVRRIARESSQTGE